MISENKDEMVEKFCFSSSEYEILPFRRSSDDWTDLDANDLVQKEICPAWVLPSEPFLGRCMPSPSILHNKEGEGMLMHRKYTPRLMIIVVEMISHIISHLCFLNFKTMLRFENKTTLIKHTILLKAI